MIHALIWTVVLTLIVGGMGFGALWLDYRQQRRDRMEALWEQVEWDLENLGAILGNQLIPALEQTVVFLEAFAKAGEKLHREAMKRGWMFDEDDPKW